jgi:hypothetical protein
MYSVNVKELRERQEIHRLKEEEKVSKPPISESKKSKITH